MKYRQIIHDAWVFTQNNKKLVRWYGFWPALFSLVVGICYFTYQFYAFKSSPLFEGWERAFVIELIDFIFTSIAENSSVAVPVLIGAGIVVLLNFLLPPLCQGALIQIIARRYNGQEIKAIEGVKYGLLSFLRLFKFQLMMRGLSILSIAAPAAIILRTWGGEAIPIVAPIFGFFIVIALILNLLFTYGEFFVVIDSEDVFPAISKSCGLVVSHWQMTFLIGILMLIIGARIILQVIFVLLVPTLVILPASYIATVTLEQTGLIIGGITGFLALCFAAYLSATIHVFADAVWVITFLELSTEEEISARSKSVDFQEVLEENAS